MTFKLGARSLAELNGVHPRLVGVVQRAIQLTVQDFAVHDGLRTEVEQAKLVQGGSSWTMDSKHMRQADGYGHAVDLVPYINGKLRWEWEAIYPIAEAMRKAAIEQGVRIRWGGHWSELTNNTTPPSILVERYVALRRKAGKPARIDGPHYEIIG